jgi:hypothetical protein
VADEIENLINYFVKFDMDFAEKLRKNVLNSKKDNELSKVETWYQRWSNKNLESMKTRCIIASKEGLISTVYEVKTEILDVMVGDDSMIDHKLTLKKCHMYGEKIKRALAEMGIKSSVEVIFDYEKISPDKLEVKSVSFFLITMSWN